MYERDIKEREHIEEEYIRECVYRERRYPIVISCK